MVTIKDIAKKTGYGVSTVSRALNGYTDIGKKATEEIKRVALELGYIPNSFGRSLSTNQSYTIGIVFEERSDFGLTHPYFSQVLSDLKHEFEQNSYDLLLISKRVGQYVDLYIKHCKLKGVDGIVVMSNVMDKENFQHLLDSDIPAVYVDYNNVSKNCVFTNNEVAIYNVCRYLHEMGHKRVAFLAGDYYDTVGNARYNGFLRGQKDFNFVTLPNWYLYAFKYELDTAYKVVTELLHKDKDNLPTAIIATSDIMAIGTIEAIKDFGLNVPNDISVVGFDNIKLSSVIAPPLTTVAQDTVGIAKNVVEMLLNTINGKQKTPKVVLVDGKLIERKSVANLNKK